jgi:hypothetical protein
MINVIVTILLIGSNCSNGQDENPAIQIANGGKELKDVVERERTTTRSTARSTDKPAAALHCIIDH